MDDLCPNCNSSLHARCCSWCGTEHKRARIDNEHCSAKCDRQAKHADDLSAAIERDEQAAQLDAATRRGVERMRSLVEIIRCTDSDLTGQEGAELKLAIAWLDKVTTKRRRS